MKRSVIRDFLRPWVNKVAILGLILFVLIGIGADFLASDIPIFVKNDEQRQWPLISSMFQKSKSSYRDWKSKSYQKVIYPIIPFSSDASTDLGSRFLPPLSTSVVGDRSYMHWLGTDRLGRDVAAGMIHGCRKSIFIGFIAMLIALLIGSSMGAIAGYWGNDGLRFDFIPLMVFLILQCYLMYLVHYRLLDVLMAVLLGAFLVFVLLSAQRWSISKKKKVRFPFDALLLRSIEVFNSLPTLLMLLAIAAIIQRPSLLGLGVIIGLIRWTRFARFTRAEVMKIKAQDYIIAAKISGQSSFNIIVRYILPQTLGPILVVFAFGIASVVLLESTLSFLGIGVPIEEVTWGSLLGQARSRTSAWWLAFFPGLAIFILIVSLNVVGDGLKKSLQFSD